MSGLCRSPGLRLSDVAEGMEEEPPSNWDTVHGQLDDLLAPDQDLPGTEEAGSEHILQAALPRARSGLPPQLLAVQRLPLQLQDSLQQSHAGGEPLRLMRAGLSRQ